MRSGWFDYQEKRFVLDKATLSFWPHPRFVLAPDDDAVWHVAVTDTVFTHMARGWECDVDESLRVAEQSVACASDLVRRGFTVLALNEAIAWIESQPETASTFELVSALQRLFFIREPYSAGVLGGD